MGTLEGRPVRRPRAAEMTRVVSNIISPRISKIRSSDFCRSIRTAAPLAERRRKGPFSTRTGHRAELADRSLCPINGHRTLAAIRKDSGIKRSFRELTSPSHLSRLWPFVCLATYFRSMHYDAPKNPRGVTLRPGGIPTVTNFLPPRWTQAVSSLGSAHMGKVELNVTVRFVRDVMKWCITQARSGHPMRGGQWECYPTSSHPPREIESESANNGSSCLVPRSCHYPYLSSRFVCGPASACLGDPTAASTGPDAPESGSLGEAHWLVPTRGESATCIAKPPKWGWLPLPALNSYR